MLRDTLIAAFLSVSMDDDNVKDVLRVYTPAKSRAYYKNLSVSKEARIVTKVESLTGKQTLFLESLGVDIVLWDGTQGSNGLRFDNTKTSVMNYEPPSLSSSEVSRLRNLFTSLRRASLRPQPNQQQALNGKLLLDTESKRQSAQSLVREAKDRLLVMWDEDTAKNWGPFLRPALLARVFGHDPTGALAFGPVGAEQNKLRKKAVILNKAYLAARKTRLIASIAFSDANEALHGLFGLETSVRDALEDLQKDGNPHVRAVVNVLYDILGQGFVGAVLQGLPVGQKRSWDVVKHQMSSAGNAKGKKPVHGHLRKAYKELGGFYEAVKTWKISVKAELEEAHAAEGHTFERLLDCWEDLLDV